MIAMELSSILSLIVLGVLSMMMLGKHKSFKGVLYSMLGPDLLGLAVAV